MGRNLPKINGGVEGGKGGGGALLQDPKVWLARCFFSLLGIGSQANILWRQKHYKMIWLEAE